jgi:hypothetical protein
LKTLERLRRLLPGCWAGALLCLALIAAPAIFALLERTDAGRVVSRIFLHEAWLSLVLGLVLLVLERLRASLGLNSALSAEILLTLGTMFCTLAGYFAVQPFMTAARAGESALSFGQLHAMSALFFGAKILLLGALAWRGAGPNR